MPTSISMSTGVGGVVTTEHLSSRPRTAALGNFDGVHIGHRAVIAGCDTVVTFDPHPLTVLHPERAPRMLGDPTTKWWHLRSLGVAEVVTIRFDRECAAMDASVFVDEILVRRLNVRTVHVGPNFRFGARGRGDVAMLDDDPRFRTAVAPLVRLDADAVSSSRIRELIARGDLERAVAMLDHPYTLPMRMTSSSGELAGDPHRCVPGAGRYAALLDGVPTTVTVWPDGLVRADGLWPTGIHNVSFLAPAR